MAKALADPLRIRIMLELNRQDMSPTQFFEKFGGGSVSKVDRHFKVLVKYGWLEKTSEKTGGRRRGSTEHFYRATGPMMFDNESWSGLPGPLRDALAWQAFETYANRVRDAARAGTLNSRDERHLSWTPLFLDQRGWENVVTKVDEALSYILKEQVKAKQRMEGSGEEAIPITVGLAAFESPPDSQRSDLNP
jgi:DNA-binding transcriptional ArsR family regulator